MLDHRWKSAWDHVGLSLAPRLCDTKQNPPQALVRQDILLRHRLMRESALMPQSWTHQLRPDHADRTPFQSDTLSLLCVRDAGIKGDSALARMASSYGSDAVRFAIAMQPGWPPESSRLKGASALTAKLWNCLRYACVHLHGDEPLSPHPSTLSDMDKWFLQRLNTLTAELNDHFERNRLVPACARLLHFIRHDLSGWYLEYSRAHMQNPATRQCVRYAMLHVAHLLHPLMPNITQETFSRLGSDSEKLLLRLPYPEFRGDWAFSGEAQRTDMLRGLIREIRRVTGLHFMPAPNRITIILSPGKLSRPQWISRHKTDIRRLSGIMDLRVEESPPADAIRVASQPWSIFFSPTTPGTRAAILLSLRKENDELSSRIHRMQRKIRDRAFMDSVAPATARRWKLRLQQDLSRREKVLRNLSMLTVVRSGTGGGR